MAGIRDLRQIEDGLEALRHRPVQISVVDDLPSIPASVAASIGPAAGSQLGRVRALVPRRPPWLETMVVEGATALAAAGTLAPGAIEHGSAQVVLVGVGGALLGTLSARLMDRASKWFDRAAEGRETS